MNGIVWIKNIKDVLIGYSVITFIAVPEHDLVGINRDNHGQTCTVQRSHDGRLFGSDGGHIVDA